MSRDFELAIEKDAYEDIEYSEPIYYIDWIIDAIEENMEY